MQDDDDDVEVMTEDQGPDLPERKPIIQVYATVAEWATHDPILQDGQLGIEYDPATKTAKMKAGWGKSRWSELPYMTGMAVSLSSNIDGDQTLDTVPAPREAGMTMVSIGLKSLGWQYPDSGTYAAPTMYAPRILRQVLGGGFGPPMNLPEGQLAVNLNGDLSSDQRPSLYVGGIDHKPICIVSENDLLINLKPRAYGATGGANVAEAINGAPEPVQLAESELLVVTRAPHVFLLGGLPGRYGGLGFKGPGGPGRSVGMSDFILVSTNMETASAEEILNGSAPHKSVNAGSQLLSALQTLIHPEVIQKTFARTSLSADRLEEVTVSEAAFVKAREGQGTTGKGLILDGGKF